MRAHGSNESGKALDKDFSRTGCRVTKTFPHMQEQARRTIFFGSSPITPRCLAGERACPPEDAGGISGYTLLLEALQNPEHPEHMHMRQWAGASYDPELFSVQQANSALAVLD